MNLEESDVQVAVVALTWTFLYLEDCKKSQTASLRNAQGLTMEKTQEMVCETMA